MKNLASTKNKDLVVVGNSIEDHHNYKLLMSYGIFKGTKLRVIRNDWWQEMILVEFEGKRIAIRKKDASSIKVEKLNEK